MGGLGRNQRKSEFLIFFFFLVFPSPILMNRDGFSARSGAVCDGMAYRHFSWVGVPIPALISEKKPYRDAKNAPCVFVFFKNKIFTQQIIAFKSAKAKKYK